MAGDMTILSQTPEYEDSLVNSGFIALSLPISDTGLLYEAAGESPGLIVHGFFNSFIDARSIKREALCFSRK